MRTRAALMIMAALAGCARAPAQEARRSRAPTVTEACEVVAAARQIMDFKGAMALAQPDETSRPEDVLYLNPPPEVVADLERGTAFGLTVEALRRRCPEERKLADEKPMVGGGVRVSRPWFGASRRVAVVSAATGGSRGGRSGWCAMRKDDLGIWREVACEVVVHGR